MIDLSKYKSILCLDGDLPESNFFEKLNLPVIAADGACNQLIDMGVMPEIVIGDLDGIRQELLSKVKVLHKPDQNFSDYQKSLVYLEEQHLLPTIVCGVNGGSLDHILNNINIFMGSKSILYTEQVIGQVLHAGEKNTYELSVDTKISLIGIPTATITSHGLKWELNQYVSSFPGKNSCFNRTTQPKVSIEVTNGAALILIYK